MLTPSEKGAIAEAVIAAEAMKAGVAYCADNETCYFIPIADVGSRSAVYLRLTPARNNQEFAISYAANYEFSGALAQLGERRAGSAKVAGSSPACSTK